MAFCVLASADATFDLPVSFSIVAHFTFSVTGALAAVRRGYDVVGVLVLALITAGGGGLLRDGLLLSRGPTALLMDSRLLIVVAGAAVLTLLFHRWIDRLQRPIAMIDAIGLGAFAVYGVERSLEAGLGAPGAIVGGMITAVGGGLLRDLCVREEPLLFKPGQFYALVAIGGCLLFLALLRWADLTPRQAGLITTGAVFVFRMLTIKFNWRTSAIYRGPAPPI